MKNFPVLIATVLTLASAPALRAANPPPKPAAKKPLAPLPPATTMKDIAIAEARKFDKDGNNKIDGTEAFALRNEFKTNANSHLYMFDDNSNHYLEDNEIGKIPLGPAVEKKPAPGKPAPGKPAPAQHGKSPATNHPHGATH